MQLTFGDAEVLSPRKKKRCGLVLNDVNQVVPRRRLALIELRYAIAGRRRRQPYPFAETSSQRHIQSQSLGEV